MVKEKKIRIVLEFPVGSKPHQMLEELKQERAAPTNPPIFIEALIALHRKSFPGSYYSSKRSKLLDDEYSSDSEEDKMIEQEKARIKKEKVKEKVREDALREIAKKLNGTVIEKGPGNYVVEYYNYNMQNRSKASIPLSMMDEFLVDKQYYPDKDTVLRFQAEGKCNYPVYGK